MSCIEFHGSETHQETGYMAISLQLSAVSYEKTRRKVKGSGRKEEFISRSGQLSAISK